MSEEKMEEEFAAVAQAICCPSGVCHVETIKKREDGKYLFDLPCYSLGPDVRESARKVLSIAVEAAAREIEPKEKQPCDCIKLIDDKWWGHYCDCRNVGDTDRAQSWCEAKNNATTIRFLKAEGRADEHREQASHKSFGGTA